MPEFVSSARRARVALAGVALFAIACVDRPPAPPTSPAPSFPAFVDAWLEGFAARHPSIAAGNGLHAHDDALEDFSAAAVAREIDGLRRDRARLAGLDAATLANDERVDRAILLGIIDGWLLDLDVVGTWRKNPMVYGAAIADGLHGLMTMDSAPAEVRLARAAAKLEATPRLVASARANVADPPEIYARRGAEIFRAASAMLDALPRAFASVRDAALLARVRSASAAARAAMDAYASELDARAATARAPFAIGEAALVARYRAEEMIDLDVDALVALGERALAEADAAFAAAAARVAPGKTPAEAWATVAAVHPERGHVVETARAALEELRAFVVAKRLVTLPTGEGVAVAAAPEIDLGLASMHASPPLEARPVESFYYVTDARADWPLEKQRGWLEHFNDATLAVVTAHEVMPGHWVHAMHMRKTTGKVRKIWVGLNPFPQPSSGQDGWAHYAEQLVADEGFRGNRPELRLAQLQEAMVRICRLLVSARLHARGLRLDDAARFFEERAHLPAPAARREAERGTYDPTNGGYFLGKRALLKLRRDVAAREGPAFDLRAFHDRVMQNGIAPWWAHRQLMMPGDVGGVVD